MYSKDLLHRHVLSSLDDSPWRFFSYPSSYQRHSTFCKYYFPCEVCALYHPDKGAGRLVFSTDFPIPSILIDCSTENKLAPTVINSEVFNFRNAHSNGFESIIPAIPVWSECCW